MNKSPNKFFGAKKTPHFFSATKITTKPAASGPPLILDSGASRTRKAIRDLNDGPGHTSLQKKQPNTWTFWQFKP